MTILNYFDLGTVEVVHMNGDTKEVPALIYGPFAITADTSGIGYTVTTIANGRGSATSYPTLEDAARVIALYNGVPLDWGNDNRNPRATALDLYGVNSVRAIRILRGIRIMRERA